MENYHEQLVDKIRKSLTAELSSVSVNAAIAMDFSGKDKVRNGEEEQGLLHTIDAARRYEMLGNYDIERAYCMDRAGKCLDMMFGDNHDIMPIYELYGDLKETAGSLFCSVGRYRDAGFSFLRGAMGYALAGNIEKARELLARSDGAFGITEHQEKTLRDKVVRLIESEMQE